MLGFVDKTQVVEEIISTQLPNGETECMKNDSPILVEIQTVKEV